MPIFETYFIHRFAFACLLISASLLPVRFGSAQDKPSATESTRATRDLEELKRTGLQRSRYQNGWKGSNAVTTKTELPQPKLTEFRELVLPILQAACIDCHGTKQQEGNVRLDALDPNLHTGNDVDRWTDVFAAISKGEMPPADSQQLTPADKTTIVQWLSGEIQTASIVRRQSASQSAFRRLTRYETNYALQDLLGLPWDFTKDLPPDAHTEDGFENSSTLLHLTVSQFETYQRLARSALMRAACLGEQPAPLHWGVTMKQLSTIDWQKHDEQVAKAKKEHKDDPEKLQAALKQLEDRAQQPHRKSYFRDLTTGKTVVASWEYSQAKHAIAPSDKPLEPPPTTKECVAILPAGQWINVELGNQLPDEGMLRVRVRASQTSAVDQRKPSLQLHFGWQASNEGRALLRVSTEDRPIDAPRGSPTFYQWDVPLGEIYPRNSVRKTSPMGAIPSPSEYIRLVNSSASPDDIAIDYVEVHAPVCDQWPPPSRKQLFVDSDTAGDNIDYVRQVISKFMTRAWRRTITTVELDQKMKLYERVRPACDSYEEAVVEVLATALASPNFLYIVQDADPISGAGDRQVDVTATPAVADGHSSKGRSPLMSQELATRLSMFLWCSIPDDELLELANSQRLLNPEVVAQQAARMLRDPRSHRFAQHFVHQWLNLELLEFQNFTQNIPGFDPLLKEAMQREPVELFKEMLAHDESVLNFIHADYTLANERLAKHYGLSGIYGNHFRKVSLGNDHRRGGLLTQPGLLAMNSSFPDSHPLKRGKWLLVSLLNDPPPPPPPAVPQIDLANPEIAKMTLKERIEDHRNHPACMACHVKIDPWGIAFENYDAVGRWRDEVKGKPVDATSELFNHQELAGMHGLKSFLLENRQDQFVEALVHKGTTYALGRPLKFTDRADIESISAQVRQQGDGLRSLLIAVASSELFRSK